MVSCEEKEMTSIYSAFSVTTCWRYNITSTQPGSTLEQRYGPLLGLYIRSGRTPPDSFNVHYMTYELSGVYRGTLVRRYVSRVIRADQNLIHFSEHRKGSNYSWEIHDTLWDVPDDAFGLKIGLGVDGKTANESLYPEETTYAQLKGSHGMLDEKHSISVECVNREDSFQ